MKYDDSKKVIPLEEIMESDKQLNETEQTEYEKVNDRSFYLEVTGLSLMSLSMIYNFAVEATTYFSNSVNTPSKLNNNLPITLAIIGAALYIGSKLDLLIYHKEKDYESKTNSSNTDANNSKINDLEKMTEQK